MAQRTPDQVTIVNEYQYVAYPAPNHPVVMVAVTYQKGLNPPRTVFVERDKLTDENLRRIIQEDMAAASQHAPRMLEI
ncbi:MAG: hypothetical protein M1531_09115 [Chloroflexi bacterium]|nr:hypothetical protein [Chloroflexota bacterium]